MFARLGRLVVHHPWKVIAAWLLAAVAVTAFAPGLADVTTRDQVNFLPDEYESMQAHQLAERAFAQTSDSTATIVLRRARTAGRSPRPTRRRPARSPGGCSRPASTG